MPRLAYDKPTKVCTDCKVELPIQSFSPDSRQTLKTGVVNYYRRNQCKECRKARRRKRYPEVSQTAEFKVKKQMSTLKWRYGITAEQYLELAEKQENLCAICGNPPGAKALAVDHDHETGEVRALLCVDCNLGLGRFRDNIKVMKQAIAYLEGYDQMRRPRNVNAPFGLR